MRSFSCSGGGAYPLRLDYFKFKESALRSGWNGSRRTACGRCPAGEHLSPENAPVVTVVTTAVPADDGSLATSAAPPFRKIGKGRTRPPPKSPTSWWRGSPTQRRARKRQQSGRAAETIRRDFRGAGVPPTAGRCRARARRGPPVSAGCAGGPQTSIKRVVLAVLTSPRFLYPDLGEPRINTR